MTLIEAREILAGVAWTRETPLITLFDEIVKRYDAPTTDKDGNKRPSKIVRAFTDHKRGHVSSGRVVQLLISLRQQNGLPLYALQS